MCFYKRVIKEVLGTAARSQNLSSLLCGKVTSELKVSELMLHVSV